MLSFEILLDISSVTMRNEFFKMLICILYVISHVPPYLRGKKVHVPYIYILYNIYEHVYNI